MKMQLTATISHPSFDYPVVHAFEYEGISRSDIVAQIDTLPYHRHNLEHYGKTRFKDDKGVAHEWVLEDTNSEH